MIDSTFAHGGAGRLEIRSDARRTPSLKSTVLVKREAALGTAPVFFTAISTILGAIMFLRFGYAVGSVGFLGVVAIIIVGHIVTFPTALALAEIATNQRVEGGGEYFSISRSFETKRWANSTSNAPQHSCLTSLTFR